ncbi:hypothetical protein F7Q91_02770 [Vibrio chagasii]|uniref:Uncharacterized protein n=1 Tax=Vibrio chagasii TaxID=170679 RepID=A0A7V7NWW1_9VIBR|nr:hypothetical protein [Vibrio chagasii]KAB0482343.1 hypothetical protein F7Q91_02770 [Vibrio chagasii]
MNIKILQALFLFAYCYKCNSEDEAFEDTEEGIEIENIAFNLIEQTSFPLEKYEAVLARGNVFDRTKLIVEEIVKLFCSPEISDSDCFIALSESPLFEDPAFLSENERNVSALKPWLCTRDDVLSLNNEPSVIMNELNNLGHLQGLWDFGSSKILLIKIV